MTTIAFDGKTLAADSKVTMGNGALALNGEAVKLIRGKKGHLGAWCGVADISTAVFLEWVRTGCEGDPPRPPMDETTYILVSPNGRVLEFHHQVTFDSFHKGFWAWGSGAELALGALAAGASAKKAIQVAAQFDTATGGTVRCVNLSGSKPKGH
jgi:ATP-dependent protease HslVU (ClpYQ) peptidase subunit